MAIFTIIRNSPSSCVRSYRLTNSVFHIYPVSVNYSGRSTGIDVDYGRCKVETFMVLTVSAIPVCVRSDFHNLDRSDRNIDSGHTKRRSLLIFKLRNLTVFLKEFKAFLPSN